MDGVKWMLQLGCHFRSRTESEVIMTFEQFCVGVVVTIVTLFASFVFSLLLLSGTKDDEEIFCLAWVINGILLGICITYLLYANGAMK